MNNIKHIAAYKFIDLNQLEPLRDQLKSVCQRLQLKGTILLSKEGINLMLAGESKAIDAFKQVFGQDERFADLEYKDSPAEFIPFKRLFVKIKPEIITMRDPDIDPQQMTAPHLSPEEFKQWLDENREITVLDTRNDYEIEYGTFDKAIDLHIESFSQLPQAVEEQLGESVKDKPLVMFCTGGVRCEKAAPALMKQGYKEVYQLDGGILNYFKACGGAHYRGNCFVFDERIALDPELKQVSETE